MEAVVYKLANGCLLVVPGDAKVAVINPSDEPIPQAAPETCKVFAAKLRELASTIESVGPQLESKIVVAPYIAAVPPH